MKLTHIRNLVAVAEHGSLRAAARALDVTQPALTRSITTLEEELAVPLLQRSARGVILTSYGDAFLARARTIWSEVARAKEEAAQLRGEREGSVTISVSFAAAALLVPPALKAFQRTHPNVQIRVSNAPLRVALTDLRHGRLDFVAAPLPEEPLGKELESSLLFLNEIVVVVRKGHRKAQATSLGELADERWAVSGPGAVVKDAFARAGLSGPKIGLFFDSYHGLERMIAGTDLVGTMPKQLLLAGETRALLEPLRLRQRLAPLRVSLICRSDAPLTPVADSFATLMKRAARRFV